MNDHGAPAQSAARFVGAITCVLAALALVVLDAAIVNVALPAIARSLQVPVADSVRVVTAYQLALVMALLPCANLGESLGYRRVYAYGVAVFVSASALCALAPSLDMLVAARFIQGLGGAAIMSLGVALLRFTVRPDQLGAAIGWNTLTVALASAAGPALGALTLSGATWHWLFVINLPLGLLVLLATRALPAVPGSGRKLDLTSVSLYASAFGSFVVGAELVSGRALLGAALIAGAAPAAVALIRRELHSPVPLIPLDLLRDSSFRVSVIASITCFIGQSAAMVSLPFYLQHTLEVDDLRTGLLITPWPLAVAVAAPLAGRFANRLSGAALGGLGGALLALGLALVASWPVHGDPFALLPFVGMCGAGFGLFQVSNNRNMLMSAPSERSGAAGGTQSTARLTGQTIGAVTMTLLFEATSTKLAPRLGLAIAAGLSALAGLTTLLRSKVVLGA